MRLLEKTSLCKRSPRLPVLLVVKLSLSYQGLVKQPFQYRRNVYIFRGRERERGRGKGGGSEGGRGRKRKEVMVSMWLVSSHL